MFDSFPDMVRKYDLIQTSEHNDTRLAHLHTATSLDHFSLVWAFPYERHVVGYHPRLGMHDVYPTFSVVGMVKAKQLPPMRGPAVHEDPSNASQSISLTAFNPAAAAGLTRLSCYIQDRCDRVVVVSSPFEVWFQTPTVDISNHYFTRSSSLEHVPFSMIEDPHGVLANLKPEDSVRSHLNVVEYMKGEVISSTKIQYRTSAPFVFKYSDIVELRFILALTDGPYHTYKLSPVLKRVTLLEDIASQKSQIVRPPKRHANDNKDIRKWLKNAKGERALGIATPPIVN